MASVPCSTKTISIRNMEQMPRFASWAAALHMQARQAHLHASNISHTHIISASGIWPCMPLIIKLTITCIPLGTGNHCTIQLPARPSRVPINCSHHLLMHASSSSKRLRPPTHDMCRSWTSPPFPSPLSPVCPLIYSRRQGDPSGPQRPNPRGRL